MVTVIVVTYGGHHKYLGQALASIPSDCELIIVNNDPEHPLTHKDALNLDKAVETGEARNIGVKRAKTEKVVFLDGDDWLMPNAVYYLNEAYESFKAQNGFEPVVYGSLLHGGKGTVFEFPEQYRGRNIKLSELYDPPNETPSPKIPYCILISRETYWAVGGNDPDMTTWEELFFARKLYCQGVVAIRVPQVIYYYRWVDNGRRSLGNVPTHATTALKFMYNTLKDYYDGNKVTAFIKEKNMTPCNTCGEKKVNLPPTLEPSEVELPSVASNELLYVKYVGSLPTYEFVGVTETRYRFHRGTRSGRKVVYTEEFNPVYEIHALDAEKAVKLDLKNWGHVFKAQIEVVFPAVIAEKIAQAVAEPPVIEVVEPVAEPPVVEVVEPIIEVVEHPTIDTFSIKTLSEFLANNEVSQAQIEKWSSEERSATKPRKGVLKLLN